jgi:hypothetical protein
MDDPRIYITAILVPLGFFLIRERRLYILGLGWVFLSFLPQSLSGMTSLDPRDVISVSISRQLYLPSAGAAIAFTALLAGIRDRFSQRTAVVVILLFLLLYIPWNFTRVSVRGQQWRDVGIPMLQFLTALKKAVPQLPPNTYIHMDARPTGRAYVQQGLRAFYHTPSIYWIVDPDKFQPKAGDTALRLSPRFEQNGDVRITVSPLD